MYHLRKRASPPEDDIDPEKEKGKKKVIKKRKLRKKKIPVEDDFIVFDEDFDEETFDEDEDKDNYWKGDGSILYKCIAQEISSATDIPMEDIKDSVKLGVTKGMKLITDEYVGATPADELWKAGMDEADKTECEAKLKKIRTQISNEIPTMKLILESSLNKEELKRCIKLYDILQNSEPYTEDSMRLSDNIYKIIESSQSRNPLEIERLDHEEDVLRKLAISQISLRDRIIELPASNEIKASIYRKFRDYQDMDPTDSNYTTIGEWIDWALSVPYDSTHSPFPIAKFNDNGEIINRKECDKFISHVRTTFNEKLYGMESLKNRIVEQICGIMTNPKTSGIHWALAGPPGVGKTRVGQVLSDITGLKYERVSLGGMDDSMFLAGGDKTYIGASPGIILQILRKVGTRNCIIQLDEVDKLSLKCQYLLLQLLDETTNSTYRDTFLKEIPIDLRGIIFLLSMNDVNAVDRNLLDRTMVIRLNGYNSKDKREIIKKFTLKDAIKSFKFSPQSIQVENNAWSSLFAREPTESNDKGLRWAQKTVHGIVGILNLARTSPTTCPIKNITFPLVITPSIMKDLLTEYLKGTEPPLLTYVI